MKGGATHRVLYMMMVVYAYRDCCVHLKPAAKKLNSCENSKSSAGKSGHYREKSE
jgi:hypothetical protein